MTRIAHAQLFLGDIKKVEKIDCSEPENPDKWTMTLDEPGTVIFSNIAKS